MTTNIEFFLPAGATWAFLLPMFMYATVTAVIALTAAFSSSKPRRKAARKVLQLLLKHRWPG